MSPSWEGEASAKFLIQNGGLGCKKPNQLQQSVSPRAWGFFFQLLCPVCLKSIDLLTESPEGLCIWVCACPEMRSKEKDDVEMSSPALASHSQVSLQLSSHLSVKFLGNKLVSASAEAWELLAIQ